MADKSERIQYHLYITGTADWFSVEFVSDEVLLKPPGTSFNLVVQDGPNVSRQSISDQSLLVVRRPCGAGPVDIDVYLDAPKNLTFVIVKIGHGDNGEVVVRSDVDKIHTNKTGDHELNEDRYRLALTKEGKRSLDSEREKEKEDAAGDGHQGGPPAATASFKR